MVDLRPTRHDLELRVIGTFTPISIHEPMHVADKRRNGIERLLLDTARTFAIDDRAIQLVMSTANDNTAAPADCLGHGHEITDLLTSSPRCASFGKLLETVFLRLTDMLTSYAKMDFNRGGRCHLAGGRRRPTRACQPAAH